MQVLQSWLKSILVHADITVAVFDLNCDKVVRFGRHWQSQNEMLLLTGKILRHSSGLMR
jgi:hypothetical protein